MPARAGADLRHTCTERCELITRDSRASVKHTQPLRSGAHLLLGLEHLVLAGLRDLVLELPAHGPSRKLHKAHSRTRAKQACQQYCRFYMRVGASLAAIGRISNEPHTPEAGQHGDGILRVLVCAQLACIVLAGGSCEVEVLGVSSLRGVRVWLRCCNKLAPSGRFLLMFSPWSTLKAASSVLHSSVSVLPACTRPCQKATQVRTLRAAEKRDAHTFHVALLLFCLLFCQACR